MQRPAHRPCLAFVAAGVLAVVLLAVASPTRAATQASTDDAAQAPQLDGPKTISLPAAADEIIPAGGGRYLLLRIDKLAKLAVYDVAQDRIKGYIPLGSTDTLVAGSLEKVVLVSRDKNVIQRWKIDPLEKELTVALVVAQVDDVVMGHASQGPVLVMTRSGPQFFSLSTLKPLDLTFNGPNGMGDWRPHPQYPIYVAASADGQSFAGWYRGLSPPGLRLIHVQGDTIVARHEHDGAGVLLPSWDGSQLFTQNGVYSADLKPLGADQFRQKTCIPAYRPGYFLTLSWPDPYRNNNGNPKPAGVSLSVYTASDRSMLVTLPPIPEVTVPRDGYANAPGTLQWHERVFLVPQHQRLVTVSDTRDQLVARPFDMMETLNRAGIDYLFVDSLPATMADPGKPYQYSIVVRSKKGAVKFSLDSGPQGMKLSKDGVLSWQVPADADPGPAGVIVTIEDASGQNVFHTFNIQVNPNPSRPGASAKKIELGPDPNHGYSGGSGSGQPPIVRAVKKPAKGTSSAKTE
jgi:hypothetical protein